MKIKIVFTIAFIGLFLINNSCKKEEIDYTYEILDIQWVDDGLDFDQDGYVTSRTIKFFVSLLEDVQRDIVIKVYYKLSETKEYIFYSSTDKPGIVGGEDMPVFLELGLNPELSEGMYSFLIEVSEMDSDRAEASVEIESAPFERLVGDQNYDLIAWWTNPYDYDYDGFPRSADLNLDINITNNVTKEIRVEVLYKNAVTDDEYTSYFKSEYYQITGENADSLTIPTGVYPDTLKHGAYNFKVIVVEKRGFSPVLIFDSELSNDLKQIPFETNLDDGYYYTLNATNTEWKYIIDNDEDGYSQSRILRLDMDIDKPETVNVLAKIFRKGIDEEDYLIMDSTSIFPIFGSSINDTIWIPFSNVTIEDTLKMPHGEWSFMLVIFEILPGDLEPEVRFATDSIDGNFFMNQKFELSSEDI